MVDTGGAQRHPGSTEKLMWRHHLDVGPDNTVHVWPDIDQVQHDTSSADCVCVPTLEEQANGNVLVVHHSLDGRELAER